VGYDKTDFFKRRIKITKYQNDLRRVAAAVQQKYLLEHYMYP